MDWQTAALVNDSLVAIRARSKCSRLRALRSRCRSTAIRRVPPDRIYLFPAPSLVAHRSPIVVIRRVSPHVHHAVVHRRSAEVLTSGPAARPSHREARVRLVHRAVLPIDLAACANQLESITSYRDSFN